VVCTVRIQYFRGNNEEDGDVSEEAGCGWPRSLSLVRAFGMAEDGDGDGDGDWDEARPVID
jgi:hypothetical protein